MSVRIVVRICVMVLGAAIGWGLAGCAEAATDPEPANVAGIFHATSLLVGDRSAARDALADGAQMRLVVRPDGTTSGSFALPAGLVGTSAVVLPLVGSWELAGATLWLATYATPFPRDLAWTVGRHILTTADAVAGAPMRITLER